MPTVMLTTHCPNRCDWCFARPRMEDYLSRGIREMSWEDFLAVVDFYERMGEGGSPHFSRHVETSPEFQSPLGSKSCCGGSCKGKNDYLVRGNTRELTAAATGRGGS
jgi:hypothetical protein